MSSGDSKATFICPVITYIRVTCAEVYNELLYFLLSKNQSYRVLQSNINNRTCYLVAPFYNVLCIVAQRRTVRHDQINTARLERKT